MCENEQLESSGKRRSCECVQSRVFAGVEGRRVNIIRQATPTLN